jgi:hypothetical protein
VITAPRDMRIWRTDPRTVEACVDDALQWLASGV